MVTAATSKRWVIVFSLNLGRQAHMLGVVGYQSQTCYTQKNPPPGRAPRL